METQSHLGSKTGQTDIKSLMPVLPRRLRWINAVGGWLDQRGAFPNLLSVEAIIKQARRKTGLSDWGAEDLLTPLQMLTQPDVGDAGITFIGKLSVHQTLVDCLINRLYIQDEVRRDPEVRGEQITKPLFIASMPRTGSTLLQRLLSQDPRCRPLLCWEALQPAPAPTPQTYHTDPRIARTGRWLKRLFNAFPQLASMHYMDAQTPEECEWLLHNTFVVPGFFAAKPEFPQYHTWSEAQDRTAAYAYYKLQLQILQKNFPPAHWVLKGNEHMKSLDVLLATFPDACVIQTHRDPLKSIPSLLSLNLRLFGLKYAPTEAFLAETAQSLMKEYAQILAKATTTRAQCDPARFFDVHYPDLVSDPVGVIRQIYDYFGYPFDDIFAAKIKQWLADNPQSKYGTHRYCLEQYGLTADQVRSRFQAYCEYFHVQSS